MLLENDKDIFYFSVIQIFFYERRLITADKRFPLQPFLFVKIVRHPASLENPILFIDLNRSRRFESEYQLRRELNTLT